MTSTLPKPTRLRASLLGLVLATTLGLTGCGGTSEPDEPEATPTAEASESPSPSPSETVSGTPSDQPATSQVIDVSITGDEVLPQAQAVEVGVGEPLRLTVTSDRAGELHVHSNPEQLPTFEEGNTSMQLVFDKPGQVDIEEHESGVLILRVLVK